MDIVFKTWLPKTALLVVALVLTIQQPVISQSSPANQQKVKSIATNLTGFGIPFRIDGSDEALIEVQLYVSEDRGKNWRFYDRQPTAKTEFPFTADSDGEYWFSIKTLDRNRKLLPEGDALPELVVLVDTVDPKLEFQVQADPAGRINCRWIATDQHLDPGSLQIFYQPTGSYVDPSQADEWSKVPATLNGTARNGAYSDQISWWPETTARSLNVRMVIADLAGNSVQHDRQLTVPPSPWRHRSQSTSRGGEPRPPAIDPLADSVTVGSGMNAAKQIPKQDRGAGWMKQSAAPINQSRKEAIATHHRKQKQLIGEPPEFAAPPIPDGYIPAKTKIATSQLPPLPSQNPSLKNSANSLANVEPTKPNSQNWDSVTERWTPKKQFAVSSTLNAMPDRQILPNPFVESQHAEKRKQSVANQSFATKSTQDTVISDSPMPLSRSTIRRTEDQVISESSTKYPSNQYQGLALIKQPVAQGELLPAQPIGDVVGSQQPAPQSPRQEIQNFRSASAPLHSRKPINRNNQPSNPSTQIPSRLAKAEPTGLSDSATQMIGTRRFRLSYGIDAIDPSGVAKVDLWTTRDGGRNWQSWGSDPDSTSPFPVEVDEEGLYGFRIVVHSKDGLTGRGPSSGDRPDILINVDTQSPLAKITSVPYGRGDEAGKLAINYSVADRYLVIRPITLAYSSNPEGPWQLIEDGVRNEGRYLWKPSSNVPDRVFLRIDARDKAGNTGVHILSQAIDVSGLIPRGTIHGVTPVGR